MSASLRATLLTGLVLLNVVVIGGVMATTYARARREAHAALRDDLRLRAATLAGLVEIGPEGPEVDLPPAALPEYANPESGVYAAIVDPEGGPVARSPSLGRRDLSPAGPWLDGTDAYAEIEEGPDGAPCAVLSRSFVARAEKARDAWTPPSEERRRYRAVIAAHTGPRDRGLASLAAFLAAIGAAALGATLLGGFAVARRVLGPIRRMTSDAAALSPQEPARRLQPGDVVPELRSLAETLNSALDRLGAALERERRFTSDASHELRTPLAVLLGNAELLLRRDRAPEEYRRGLERQRRVAERMIRMTQDLLLLARSDDGRTRLRRERLDLRDVTRGVCDELAPLAAENDVALACDTDGACPASGDPSYLAGLVQNLVVNAVKFTPTGGSVRVRVRRDDEHALLEVEDTGRGIAPEHLPHVFERFYRAHGGADRHEGAGLGLAIADWIARAHGGRIDVVSEVGRGTTFVVRLPLDIGAKAAVG